MIGRLKPATTGAAKIRNKLQKIIAWLNTVSSLVPAIASIPSHGSDCRHETANRKSVISEVRCFVLENIWNQMMEEKEGVKKQHSKKGLEKNVHSGAACKCVEGISCLRNFRSRRVFNTDCLDLDESKL